MKKKLFALFLAGVMAFSIAGCMGKAEPTEGPKESTKSTESAKPKESKATEIYSRDFEAGVQSVTVQDLTYSVPKAWDAEDGENGSTYYYTESDDSFLSVTFNEITTGDYRVTDWELFNIYMDGMEESGCKNTGREMRQNKNRILYAHYTGELDLEQGTYDIEGALFDCEGGNVHIGFISKKNSEINYTQDINSIFDSVEVPERPSNPPDDGNSPIPTEPSQEVPSVEPSESVPVEPSETTTLGQRNALAKAEQYLSIMAFSHRGLVAQLKFEGYTTDEATYGADNCGANWNEQAAKKAQQYMELMSFSRQRLIDQLKYDGFTQSQAEYGASAVGY